MAERRALGEQGHWALRPIPTAQRASRWLQGWEWPRSTPNSSCPSVCPQAHSSQTQASNLYLLGLPAISSCRHLIISVGQTSPTLGKSFFTEKSPYPLAAYPWPLNVLPPRLPGQHLCGRLCPPSFAPAPAAGSNEEHTHKTFIVGNTPCRVCQIPAPIGEAGSVGCRVLGFRGFARTFLRGLKFQPLPLSQA